MGIQVFVSDINGSRIVVLTRSDATSQEFFNSYSEASGVDLDKVRLVFKSQQLEIGSGKKLEDYHIQDKSVIFVVNRLEGGLANNDLEEN